MPRADTRKILADLDRMRLQLAEDIVEANDRGMEAVVERFCVWDEVAADAEKAIRELSGITTLTFPIG